MQELIGIRGPCPLITPVVVVFALSGAFRLASPRIEAGDTAAEAMATAG